MAHTRYENDRGLSARMGVVMFGIGLLYVLFAVFFVAIGLSPVLVLVIAGGMLVGQWYFSDRLALRAMNGREVTPAQAPELHAMIDRLCALADMPKPRVAIAETDVPNAFATGRSPSRAVVCVTTGILRRLERDELEAVLAHELAHVAHRDVSVMTVASFLGVLAGMITRFGLMGGLGNRRGNDKNGALVFLLVLVVSVVVYVLAFLLTRALSRYRELSADRAGAILIGAPSALGSALQKISGEMARVPTRDLRAAEPFNAFFFAPAIAKGFSLSSLISTHPPLERRLEQLAQIQADMNRPGPGMG
ncbi:MAG: zinc metalloprotease HtpX [Sporichthyaceae bacterium]